MKRIITLVLFLSGIYFGQYQIKSPYLQEPELVMGYVDSCAQLWLSAWDDARGGFYTNVSKDGSPNFGWGSDKDMITQSRNAYGYVRAFMLTGEETYLETAKEALDFMYEHAWDNNYGGWYNDLNEFGNPVGTNNSKTAFIQHYALLGIVAYYEATGDSLTYEWLQKAYDQNELLWDDDSEDYGYYDYVNFNWNSKFNKSFNATVDAVTTHLMSLYTMTREQKYLDRWTAVNDNILDYLVTSMDQNAIGIAESYSTNWTPLSNHSSTLAGHVMKTAWCLVRASYYNPDPEYIPAAEKLFNDILDNGGYDHENGGPYKDFNRFSGQMLMYGNPDTAKAWWQMEQAITGGLHLYNVTGNEMYLQIADESLDFFMKYFVDPVYGDIYENRTKYGGETWGEHKGNGYKAAYHSIETGFYTYLYGNLFVHEKSVKLHYKYDAADEDRTFILSPLAMYESGLIIRSVTKDGTDYTNFSSADRTLTLPAGESGVFLVEFEPVEVTNVIAEVVSPAADYSLSQNYPNPFNPSTSIRFSIANSEHVALDVYTILGEKVAELVNDNLTAGNYSVRFDGSNLSSGMYIYTLKAGDFSKSGKMLLIK